MLSRPLRVLTGVTLVSGLLTAADPVPPRMVAPAAQATAPVTGPAARASRVAGPQGTTTPRVTAPAPTGREWHVAVRGRDDAAGSSRAPLARIGTAISRARSGDRIVVHAGSYHESLTVPTGKTLHIRAADGAKVWLDGSVPVDGWRPSGTGFATVWRVDLDASPTYSWGEPDGTEAGWTFVNPDRPMAAHPDQVWLDGEPQRQVGSQAELVPGTFYVDDAADLLHLGSDPSGRKVRASVLPRAIALRAAGTSVRGVGVRRFAPSVPHMGAVTAEAAGVTLTGMRIVDNSTTGLHVSAPGVRVQRVRVVRNGMLGMSATYADRLRLVRAVARRNNTEGFNTSPVAGGAKIGRSRDVVVRRSRFAGNAGTGLWFDESAYDIAVLDTTLRGNDGHGLSLELSTHALVADTLVADNRGHGVKVNNTAQVSLWNNTVVRNGRAINIVQDERDIDDPETPGHDPRRPLPDPTMDWVVRDLVLRNNILGAAQYDANCLLCVEDYSGRWTAEELGIDANGNVYQRPRASAPQWVVVWSRGAGDPAVFTSVRDFEIATGRERQHLDLVGTAAVTPSLRPSPLVRSRQSAVAVALARRPARMLDRPPGTRHIGAWR